MNKELELEMDRAFRLAVRHGYFCECKLLLEHGANVHANDDFALRWAAHRSYFEICKLLLEHGANVHANDDYALRYAIDNGHLKICRLLLKYGADLKVLLTEEKYFGIIHELATIEQIKIAKDELEVQKIMEL